MERVIVVKVNDRQSGACTTKEMTQWAQRFAVLIKKVSCTLGEVIRIGQWLHSAEGQLFYRECLSIVPDELGNSSKISRIAQSAACVLFAARKVWKYFKLIIVHVGGEGGLMVRAPKSGSGGPGSSPGWGTALCSWARYFTLIVPLSTQAYKWVPAKVMVGVTLQWTSIQ